MPTHETKPKPGDAEPLILPPLNSKPAILAAVNEVVQALAGGRIKCSVADTLLSAIRLANRLLNEINEAGLSIYPSQQPTRPSLEPAGKKTQSTTWQPTGQVAARIAASGSPHHSTVDSCSWHRPIDGLVEEMMAQVHQHLDKKPLKNPLFQRA